MSTSPDTPSPDNPAEQEQEAISALLSASRDWPLTAKNFAALKEQVMQKANLEHLIDVAYTTHDTPLGKVSLFTTAKGLLYLGLPNEDIEELQQYIGEKVSHRIFRTSLEATTLACHQLDDYFEGTLKSFSVPLDWQLAHSFRKEALHASLRIAYGSTCSYKELAAHTSSPGAVRAVGSAMATNPFPIFVPCHRVLRSDGSLGNYRGGLNAKVALITLEASNS